MSAGPAISGVAEVGESVIVTDPHLYCIRECFVYVVHATAMTLFAVLFMHVQVVTRFLMAGSPLLPWLAAIMTTRVTKEPVPLTEDDNKEVLMKIECRSNLRSNTDTILFQVRNSDNIISQ